jgi:hypothetical protein
VKSGDCSRFGDGDGEGWEGCQWVVEAIELQGDLLSPERFLTKICIVSSGSAEGAREEVEETLEMLLERMTTVGVGLSMMVAVV